MKAQEDTKARTCQRFRLVQTQGARHNGRSRLPGYVAPAKLYGQETNVVIFAMAWMNAFSDGTEAEVILANAFRKAILR